MWKKILLVCLIALTDSVIFAAPPPDGPGRRFVQPVPTRGDPGRGGFGRDDGHHGNDGLRTATDIVNLVGASLNLLRPATMVVVPAQLVVSTSYAPMPTYVQPTQVFVQQPVYVASAVIPVVVSIPASVPYRQRGDWRGGGDPHDGHRPQPFFGPSRR